MNTQPSSRPHPRALLLSLAGLALCSCSSLPPFTAPPERVREWQPEGSVRMQMVQSVLPPEGLTKEQIQHRTEMMHFWVQYLKDKNQLQRELSGMPVYKDEIESVLEKSSDARLQWRQILSGAAAGWATRGMQ